MARRNEDKVIRNNNKKLNLENQEVQVHHEQVVPEMQVLAPVILNAVKDHHSKNQTVHSNMAWVGNMLRVSML